MKSVIVISVITFVIIFGGVIGLSAHLGRAARSGASADLGPEDHAAADRIFEDIARERDRLQREREEIIDLRQTLTVQEEMLERTKNSLGAIIAKLESRQQQYIEERERSATKLAKMYEAMKPAKAAPILAVLELDIILDIMSRMNERPAAKILSYMDAGLAAQISTRMSLQGAD
jgi:flagellar motility protein MotE (MotC chaperone)